MSGITLGTDVFTFWCSAMARLFSGYFVIKGPSLPPVTSRGILLGALSMHMRPLRPDSNLPWKLVLSTKYNLEIVSSGSLRTRPSWHSPPSRTTSEPAIQPIPPCLSDTSTATKSPISSGEANLPVSVAHVLLHCSSLRCARDLPSGRSTLLPFACPRLCLFVWRIGDHVGRHVSLDISFSITGRRHKHPLVRWS